MKIILQCLHVFLRSDELISGGDCPLEDMFLSEDLHCGIIRQADEIRIAGIIPISSVKSGVPFKTVVCDIGPSGITEVNELFACTSVEYALRGTIILLRGAKSQ